MKYFLIQTSIFFFPLLCGALVMEIMLQRIPNNYSQKHAFLTKFDTDTLETLILGSSHAVYGMDPTRFSSPAYNNAHVSQSFRYDHLIASQAFQYRSHLKNLIIPVSYFSFRTSLDQAAESWRVKNYVLYYGCDSCSQTWSHRLELLNGSLSSHLTDLYRYYFQKPPRDHVTINEYGSGTKYLGKPQQDLEQTGRAAASRHTHALDSAMVNESSQYLEKMISEARQRGIRVLLITLPASSYYREHLDPAQLEEMTRTCQRLADGQSGVRYLNWLDHPAFSDEYFRDGDHLNEHGAEVCSGMLDNELENWTGTPEGEEAG